MIFYYIKKITQMLAMPEEEDRQQLSEGTRVITSSVKSWARNKIRMLHLSWEEEEYVDTHTHEGNALLSTEDHSQSTRLIKGIGNKLYISKFNWMVRQIYQKRNDQKANWLYIATRMKTDTNRAIILNYHLYRQGGGVRVHLFDKKKNNTNIALKLKDDLC